MRSPIIIGLRTFGKNTHRMAARKLHAGMQTSGLWDELATDWIVLDAELLPWSAKAGDLLRQQYGPTGADGTNALRASRDWANQAAARGIDFGSLPETLARHAEAVDHYVDEYRRYSWPVSSMDDLRLAPFHVLAYEGTATLQNGHRWHLGLIDRLCTADTGLFRATERRYVDLADPMSEAAASEWWDAIISAGSEGMVIKPVEGLVQGKKGLLQPAIKCRGREYLRIIYGPTYTEPANLARLRHRGLAPKRNLALREFVLGHEGCIVSSIANPSIACTSACSGCWHSRVSRLIPNSDLSVGRLRVSAWNAIGQARFGQVASAPTAKLWLPNTTLTAGRTTRASLLEARYSISARRLPASRLPIPRTAASVACCDARGTAFPVSHL